MSRQEIESEIQRVEKQIADWMDIIAERQRQLDAAREGYRKTVIRKTTLMEQLIKVVKAVCIFLVLLSPANADIFRWDTRELIPGTEGKHASMNQNLDGMNLQYADFRDKNLAGTTMVGTDVSYAHFERALLGTTTFTDAIIRNANLTNATFNGLTAEQLYSTKSYQDHDLRGIKWTVMDLRQLDLTGQDLTDGDFTETYFQDANLTGAKLVNANMWRSWTSLANFTGADITGATLPHNFLLEKLYTTGSYQNKDLRGVRFTSGQDGVTGYNFAGADLSGIDFRGAVFEKLRCLSSDYKSYQALHHANLTGANLTGVSFEGVCTEGAIFSGAIGYVPPGFTRTPGDSNGDGLFNSSDLVFVFAAGEYEDATAGNSDFSRGDWNGNGDFESGDLVLAFSVGAYEPQAAVAAVGVPEPSTWILLALGVLYAIRRHNP